MSNKNNEVIIDLLKYGYFSEYLPKSFCTDDLLDVIDEIMENISYRNIKPTTPTSFSLHKEDS